MFKLTTEELENLKKEHFRYLEKYAPCSVMTEEIWPLPDYKKEIEEGQEKELVCWRIITRNCLPVWPTKAADHLEWLLLIAGIRKAAESVKTTEEIIDWGKLLKEEGYITYKKDGSVKAAGKGNIRNRKMFERLIEVPKTKEELQEYMNKYLIFFSDEEKLLSRYNISESDNKWSVSYGKVLLFDNLDSKEETIKQIKKYESEISRKPYPVIGESYRDGDVRKFDIMNNFGLKFINVGYKLKNREMHMYLNALYDSLMNIAIALEIDPEDVGFNGQLSINIADKRFYGNACYSIKSRCISLATERSIGTLSHEWIHALDALCIPDDEKYTSLTDRKEDVPESMQKLINTIKFNEDGSKTDYLLNAELAMGDKNRNHSYWTNDAELLARAGAVYIEDKLLEKGIVDNYLSGKEYHIKYLIWNVPTFPHDKEREKINKAFDDFIEDLKNRGIFHDNPRFG